MIVVRCLLHFNHDCCSVLLLYRQFRRMKVLLSHAETHEVELQHDSDRFAVHSSGCSEVHPRVPAPCGDCMQSSSNMTPTDLPSKVQVFPRSIQAGQAPHTCGTVCCSRSGPLGRIWRQRRQSRLLLSLQVTAFPCRGRFGR